MQLFQPNENPVHRSFSEDLARRWLHAVFIQIVHDGHYTPVAGRARFGDEGSQSRHSTVEVLSSRSAFRFWRDTVKDDGHYLISFLCR
jgi:succinylarginine dihydrolase